MSKELEALLKVIDKKIPAHEKYSYLKLVETHLKALEIIRNKKVDVGILVFHEFNYYDYNFWVAEDRRRLTQEEIDLLKEVLEK